MRNCYYFIVLDGAVVSKNRVTICTINGIVKRYQVYSDRAGKRFDNMFKELDAAVDKFMELSS